MRFKNRRSAAIRRHRSGVRGQDNHSAGRGSQGHDEDHADGDGSSREPRGNAGPNRPGRHHSRTAPVEQPPTEPPRPGPPDADTDRDAPGHEGKSDVAKRQHDAATPNGSGDGIRSSSTYRPAIHPRLQAALLRFEWPQDPAELRSVLTQLADLSRQGDEGLRRIEWLLTIGAGLLDARSVVAAAVGRLDDALANSNGSTPPVSGDDPMPPVSADGEPPTKTGSDSTSGSESVAANDGERTAPPSLREVRLNFERQYIRAVIAAHDGSMMKAAVELQVDRTTLWKKMKGE